MGFRPEPKQYEKTALSDLQGAWENLRSEVAEAHPFPQSDRLLFHIDEAMSWESVRHLERMKAALLLVRNLVVQNEVPIEIAEWVEHVVQNYHGLTTLIRRGLIRTNQVTDFAPWGLSRTELDSEPVQAFVKVLKATGRPPPRGG